jgi:hypothetical protein
MPTAVEGFGETGMTINVTRRAALVGISAFAAFPVRAQTPPAGRPKQNAEEFAVVMEPAVFEINPVSGSLKETVQKGQELIWHRKESKSDRRFHATNISVAFLRSETGGQVKMTFSCNISSLGYLTADEAKLNVIVRARGGASLYSWNIGFSVKCADKDQALTPLTQEVPNDIAANVFTNVSAIEIAGYAEPNVSGVKVQRCS